MVGAVAAFVKKKKKVNTSVDVAANALGRRYGEDVHELATDVKEIVTHAIEARDQLSGRSVAKGWLFVTLSIG